MASSSTQRVALSAKSAFDQFQSYPSPSQSKRDALTRLKAALREQKSLILEANALDVQAASGVLNDKGKGSEALIRRLDFNSSSDKFDSMVDGIEDVIGLDDPVGKVQSITRLDENLHLTRVTCPIGVLLVIFEARPEVIVNITALAVKSGNAAILKGGKELANTQKLLSRIIHDALADSVPPNLIQTVSSREEVEELLSQDRLIDLVIPRGSQELVRHIKEHTKIPVLGHADGLCTIYVDDEANSLKAMRCAIDAKTTYPAACNSMETLLVHSALLNSVLPDLALSLLNAKVTLKLDQASLNAVKSSSMVTNHPLFWTNCSLAKDEDFETEWLTLTLSIKTVDSISAAIQHINTYSSHHTDSIITESADNANRFCRSVNSSSVYVNCSTRFADGFRYGFGTEIGISTGKIHSRGPVGLEGLVIYKWVMKSTDPVGHITSEFGGEHGKRFLHQRVPLDDSSLQKPY